MNEKLNQTCFSRLTNDEKDWVSEMIFGESDLFFFHDCRISTIEIEPQSFYPKQICFFLTEKGHIGHLYLSVDDDLSDNKNSGSLTIQNSNGFYINFNVSEKIMNEVSQLTQLLSNGKLDISFSLDPEKDSFESRFHLKNINLRYERNLPVISEDVVDESIGIQKDIQSIKSSLNELYKLNRMVNLIVGGVIGYVIVNFLIKEFFNR